MDTFLLSWTNRKVASLRYWSPKGSTGASPVESTNSNALVDKYSKVARFSNERPKGDVGASPTERTNTYGEAADQLVGLQIRRYLGFDYLSPCHLKWKVAGVVNRARLLNGAV